MYFSGMNNKVFDLYLNQKWILLIREIQNSLMTYWLASISDTRHSTRKKS